MQTDIATRHHGGVCGYCRHDLIVKGQKGKHSDGKVYCSNPKCKHSSEAYRMTSGVND